MSQASGGRIVYVNLFHLSWPSEGPKDGQVIEGYARKGPIYTPARWNWPSPEWRVWSQARQRCDCPEEDVIYKWEGKEYGILPHVNAHTRKDGSTCGAGGWWRYLESGSLPSLQSEYSGELMTEEYLNSFISTQGDWIPTYNGEKSPSETPLREGYYLVIEDREAHRVNFAARGYEIRL